MANCKRLVLLLVVGTVASLAPAIAADACDDLRSELPGKVFIAKKPLYDTRITLDGIIRFERDDEEIPKGAKLTVLNVKCFRKKIELTLRQKVTGWKPDKVEIYLFYSRDARLHPDAREDLNTIMGYVFDEPDATED